MSAPLVDVGSVQDLIARSPFLTWMGLEVLSLGDEEITVMARWREEWVANPQLGQTQGGVLAAIIDFAANLSLARTVGRPVPTIDLRVDYHRLATKGDLFAKGKVVKYGRQVSVCEAELRDESDRLIASGRGSFITSPPPEAKTANQAADQHSPSKKRNNTL